MNIEEKEVVVCPGVLIEFKLFGRGKKERQPVGIWMMQGNLLDDPNEFFIPEWEIDAHIKALQKAKAMCEEYRNNQS